MIRRWGRPMVPKRTRGARLLCIAVSSVAVAADASRAQTALLQLEEPATEKDDPAARRAAMREWRGEQAADTRWRSLQEAIKERDRWSIGVPPVPAPRAALAVQGTAFVNLGPTRADFEFNGAQYIEIDSGRVRQILVDPVDANVL